MRRKATATIPNMASFWIVEAQAHTHTHTYIYIYAQMDINKNWGEWGNKDEVGNNYKKAKKMKQVAGCEKIASIHTE